MLRAAAVVRAATSAMAAGRHLRSSSFRGRDTLGIFSTIRSDDSTIWVEQTDRSQWTVSLGMATVTGRALDWALQLTLTDSEKDPMEMTLSTPAVATTDGAQVHADEYAELREMIRVGLTAGPPNIEDEIASGLKGLEFPPFPFADEARTPIDSEFTVVTNLSFDEARTRLLNRLPFLHDEGGPTDDRWLIGLRHATPVESYADLTIESDDGGGCRLRFDVHIAHDDGHTATNLIAIQHARCLPRAIVPLVSDPDRPARLLGARRSA